MTQTFAVLFQRSDDDYRKATRAILSQPVQVEYLVECESETTAVMMALFNMRLRKEEDWTIRSVKLLPKGN